MCHCSSNLRNPALYRTTIIHIWHCYNSKHLLIHHTSAREIHYISSSIQFYKSLFCIIISRVGLPLIDKKKKKRASGWGREALQCFKLSIAQFSLTHWMAWCVAILIALARRVVHWIRHHRAALAFKVSWTGKILCASCFPSCNCIQNPA